MMENRFSIAIQLPQSKNTIRLNEINNKEYLILCKYAQNDDFLGLLSSIKILIPDFTQINNIVDKVYSLIAYRSLFISDNIQIYNRDKAIVNISLMSILSEIEQYVNNVQLQTKVNDFIITYKHIKDLPNGNNNIYDCIQSISLLDVVIEDNIESILDKLPVEVYSSINNKIIELYNSYNITIIPSNERARVDELSINLTNEQLISFILSIFKTDLNNIMEVVFAFSQHFKNVDFFKLSPLDSRVLETILHRELKEAKKQSEQDNINPMQTNF